MLPSSLQELIFLAEQYVLTMLMIEDNLLVVVVDDLEEVTEVVEEVVDTLEEGKQDWNA